MKKKLLLILALCVAAICSAFAFTACGGETKNNTHTHTYGEWQTAIEATCTKDGEQQRSCACGDVQTKPISALGHGLQNHSAKAATCTQVGWDAYQACTRCDYSTKQEIDALGHDIDYQTIDATCTLPSFKFDYCTRCGYIEADDPSWWDDASGHSKVGRCTDCGMDYLDTYVNYLIQEGIYYDDFYTITYTFSSNDYIYTLDQKYQRSNDMTYWQLVATKNGKTSDILTIGFNAISDSYFYLYNDYLTFSSQATMNGIITAKDLNAYSTTLPYSDYSENLYNSSTRAEFNMLATITLKLLLTTVDNYLNTLPYGFNAYHFGFTNYSENKIIHNYSIVSFTPATNITNGTLNIKCSHCNITNTVSIPVLNAEVENSDFVFTISRDGTYYIVTQYKGSEKSVTIPSSQKGLPVKEIGENAFYYASDIITITIPSSVTSIGIDTFYGCSSLESVYTYDIAKWCEIEFVNTWSNPLYYANNLYVNNRPVIDLVIPDSVTSICSYAFYEYTALESVIISNGVTSIGEMAFYKCSSLTNVTLGNGVTSIGINAFNDCSKLTDINYAGDIASWCNISGLDSLMGDGGFDFIANCYPNKKIYINGKELTELKIPDSVTAIGNNAFAGCISPKSITISDSVTAIGNYAFSSCSNLTEITIPDSVTSIGRGAFYKCSSLVSATIGNSVTSISNFAFDSCSALTSVTIPSNVTSIGRGAFIYCSSLSSVTIHDSVTSIDDYAFYECPSLTDVYYYGTIEQWNKIEIGTDNSYLLNAKIHYESSGELQKWSYSDTVNLNSYANNATKAMNSAIKNMNNAIGASASNKVIYYNLAISYVKSAKSYLTSMKSLADSRVEIEITGSDFSTLQEKITNAFELCDSIVNLSITSTNYTSYEDLLDDTIWSIYSECLGIQNLSVKLLEAYI